MVKAGDIVSGVLSDELVEILSIESVGNDYCAVSFLGLVSKRNNSRVFSKHKIDNLKIVTQKGEFTFKGDPEKFKLYAEAERIRSAYLFDPLYAVNCSMVDPLPHQIEAVYKHLLPLPQIRYLLADDTGAGKTIMTGLLIKELMARGLIKKILIITPGGLTKQWQEDEMGFKFNIPFKLVNRAAFQSDPNIFNSSDRLVTSIDFIRGEDVLNVIKEVHFDLVVVDEAHKLSVFEYGNKRDISKRYEAISKISQMCEHLLLLTATPHRGRADTFRYLLQLLDEDLFASDQLVKKRINNQTPDGANRFFIRRLKEQMRDWDGENLFLPRHTNTTMYELTPEEKKLYDAVTEYLTRKRKEAQSSNNVHVALTLMVMQRRLTSSLYAIKETLRKRYEALKDLVEQLKKNPDLLKLRKRRDQINIDCNDIDDYENLNDEEKSQLEAIFSNPRQFRFFTTATSREALETERDEVCRLYEMAKNIKVEESKLKRLNDLLNSQNIVSGKEKLVIFTEHKDTLKYLTQKLENSGYKVVTIYGAKNVEERRDAQADFSKDAQILIATDAAGEGINLQFCRLLINWDIPWNPNRLEQRMGRIHRYGQTSEVMVFNMVAQNTREGAVLERLLTKLDMIREQIGDDRVYDVISDIFQGVKLEDMIDATFYGAQNNYSDLIDNAFNQKDVEKIIKDQKECVETSHIDYKAARNLKEASDEVRLQPVYIKHFFYAAFKEMGGEVEVLEDDLVQITKLPELLVKHLEQKNLYGLERDVVLMGCFTRKKFWEYMKKDQNTQKEKLFLISPGDPLFDSLLDVVCEEYKSDMLQGTILIDPEGKKDRTIFFTRSRIEDQRNRGRHIANEHLALISARESEDHVIFQESSPAELLDFHAPNQFAKSPIPPESTHSREIVNWTTENITLKQYQKLSFKRTEEIFEREKYLTESFDRIRDDLTEQIMELELKKDLSQGKRDKLSRLNDRIKSLKVRRKKRLAELQQLKNLSMNVPEILGCAYLVPLNQIEYNNHYGMSRDDEAEAIAMKVAMDYEVSQGNKPSDCSADNVGYDIKSVARDNQKLYIEVKGRSVTGGIMLSENELNRLSQLGKQAWLYVVTYCKTKPVLARIQDPGNTLKYELKSKGVQYFVPEKEWKQESSKK